jgi:hypothetical protein
MQLTTKIAGMPISEIAKVCTIAIKDCTGLSVDFAIDEEHCKRMRRWEDLPADEAFECRMSTEEIVQSPLMYESLIIRADITRTGATSVVIQLGYHYKTFTGGTNGTELCSLWVNTVDGVDIHIKNHLMKAPVYVRLES